MAKEIKTVPNQKVVVIKEKEICDKEHIYAAINLRAMELAAQDLNAGAFKLWIYFSKNQIHHSFALSQKAVEDTFGIKKKQYDNAVAELIEKGYLTPVKDGSNIYNFTELVVPKRYNA